MLKHLEFLWIILIMAVTVTIFSFSARDAKNSSAQSKAVTNVFVDIVEKTTNKTIGELGGKSDNLMRFEIRKAVREIAHFLEYTLLGAITFVAIFFAKHEKKYLAVLAAGVNIAVLDEFIQTFSLGRTATLTDIFIDMLGVSVGILSGIFILKLMRGLYAKHER